MDEFMQSPSEPESRARYKITLDDGYVRAELRNRRTAEEMELFLGTVAASCAVLERSHVLISVHSSNPMSMVERSVFFAHLSKLWSNPAHRIAILGDAVVPGIPHEYVKSLAQQNGAKVRGFENEAAALQWVRDRRRGQDRRRAAPRLTPYERRRSERRFGAQFCAQA